MAGPADSTRTKLIEAAERLFATHGIDAVSLRQINRASGAKNAVAVQYHFDDRAGVVEAVLAKHRPDVEARRHAVLDQYEADHHDAGDHEAGRNGRSPGDLRSLAGALVRPLASKLADPDGGPAYLQIYAELTNRPRPSTDRPPADTDGASIQRWRALVEPLMGAEATRLHRRFTAIRFAAAELGRRAATSPHTDDRLFVSHLVDLVAAILGAPVSEETLRLADDRDNTRAESA